MINFGQIGDIISGVFDTDFIDIKRDVSGQLQEIYSNVPCHISYASVDNPDPATVDIKPIIQSFNVHCPLWVDIKNNDFIIGKKMGNKGNLLAVYSGRCGNPVVSQGRKKISVVMSATESEEPTPVPPVNPFTISIKFYADKNEIAPSIAEEIEAGSRFIYKAPENPEYAFSACFIDDVLQDGDTAIIDDVQKDYEIKFVYEAPAASDYFRYLVKGLYTKDDGTLANGYHLYKKVPIISIYQDSGIYTITCESWLLTHEDNGMILRLAAGVRMALFPGKIFIQVSAISNEDNGQITFTAVPYTPTEQEAAAYVCGWYD